MANTYAQAYQLATDQTFVQRVEMAICQIATNITSELASVANHTNRSALATKVGNNSAYYAPLFAKAICGFDLSLTAASTDTTLNNDISSIWNLMAGGL